MKNKTKNPESEAALFKATKQTSSRMRKTPFSQALPFVSASVFGKVANKLHVVFLRLYFPGQLASLGAMASPGCILCALVHNLDSFPNFGPSRLVFCSPIPVRMP